MRKTATVVGCGIVGLTSALLLQEKGWQVRILAKERFDRSLSHKVGAIWFPFEVHPKESALRWGTQAYSYYENEAKRTAGVRFIPFTVVSTKDADHSWTQAFPSGKIREAMSNELPQNAEMAYIATVPLAEPPIYLPVLFERFLKNGGNFESRTIDSLEEMVDLDQIVINCSGLGAKNLCQDEELTAMRGQILRVGSLGVPSCVNSTQAGKLSYIIQRSTDCILGGTDYLNDWNLAVDPKDTQQILDRFTQMGFTSEKPDILEEVVGLRPRRTSVRFEFDSVYSNVFHNYGHGGAGFTVAWGCAQELAGLLTEV